MLIRKSLIKSTLRTVTMISMTVTLGLPLRAEDFTAGAVVERMDASERYTFIAGIIEGLAYARFVSDGKSEEPGMRCIYTWFYEEDGATDKIVAALKAFPDHLPGAVTAALVQRRCGS